jgi:hypothetical protein
MVSPASLAFGSITLGRTNTFTFQLVNTGDLPLTGTAVTTEPFAVQSDSPFIILAGQTNLISISFAPSSASSFSNVVVFSSNGGNSTNVVTGSGVTPPQLTVLPAVLNFGGVALGSNAQASFTVTNTGGTALGAAAGRAA